MVMLLLMVLCFGVAFASVGFVFYVRGLENKNDRAMIQGDLPPNRLLTDSSGERTPLNLQINDIVSHFGDDFIVEGRMDYWEEGAQWVTYMLVDGDITRWMSAEEDDRLEVALWEDVKDLHLEYPPPRELDYAGKTFYMTEASTARVSRQGRTGNRTSLSVDYAQFSADDGEMLSVEDWGGRVEVSIGREINPAGLDILPGDQVDY